MWTHAYVDRFPSRAQRRFQPAPILWQSRWGPAIGRLFIGCVRLSLVCAIFAAQIQGQTVEDTEVKAAYLYNFAKFVEWPAGAFSTPTTPLAICVIGDEHMSEVLERIVFGKKLSGRPLEIRRPQSQKDFKFCHIMFVGFMDKEHTVEILAALRGSTALTVGQNHQFLPLGGMINLTLDHSTIRLEIDPQASQAAGLKISSRLLAVARTVNSGHAGGGDR
jgi:hypothetical protein